MHKLYLNFRTTTIENFGAAVILLLARLSLFLDLRIFFIIFKKVNARFFLNNRTF